MISNVTANIQGLVMTSHTKKVDKYVSAEVIGTCIMHIGMHVIRSNLYFDFFVINDIKELFGIDILRYSHWIDPFVGCYHNIYSTVSDILEKTTKPQKCRKGCEYNERYTLYQPICSALYNIIKHLHSLKILEVIFYSSMNLNR